MVETPWEFVTTVSIDSLEQAEDNPDVHGEDVEISSNENPEDWHTDCAGSEDHHLDWRSVFSSETEWRRVLMVDLVDVLVERTPVHGAMSPVMPGILQHKEDGNLESHCGQAWEWNSCIHSTVFRHWVEQPDLREFDGEMAEENEFGALPLFCCGWNLVGLNPVLVEIGELRDDDPGKTSAKVDQFVHHEAHDSGGEDIVLHVGIPTLQSLVVSIAFQRSGGLSLVATGLVLTAQSLSKMFK